uniref:Uncharacterized protein n=1 Tax=Anopheles merus TaxID=30066 RepID=A0A182VK09_ANOME
MKTRRPKSEKAMAVAKASQQPDLPEGKLQSEVTPGISKELPAKPLPSPNTAKSHPENPTPTRQGSVASSRLSAQLALKRLEKEQEMQKQILLAEKEKMEAGIRAKMAEMELQHETQLNALKDEIENLSIYSADTKTNRTAEETPVVVHYQAHHYVKQPAIFRIVPVTVYHGRRAINTVAFLDAITTISHHPGGS